jgi:hypothetical protein
VLDRNVVSNHSTPTSQPMSLDRGTSRSVGADSFVYHAYWYHIPDFREFLVAIRMLLRAHPGT